MGILSAVNLNLHRIQFFNSQRWKSIAQTLYLLLKPVAALFICQCLVLIRPLSRKLGNYPFLIITIQTLFYPIQATVGGQIEIIYESLLGTIIGLGWAVGSKFLAVIANRNGYSGAAVLAIFLTVGSFISGYIRSRYGYRSMCIMWIFIDCFLMTIDPRGKTVPSSFYTSLVYPSLIAAGVVFLVSLFIPPTRMASDLVGNSALSYLDELMNCLNGCLQGFFPSVDTSSSSYSSSEEYRLTNYRTVLRDRLKKFSSDLRNSQFELNFSFIPIGVLKDIESVLHRTSLAMSANVAACVSLYRAFNFSHYHNHAESKVSESSSYSLRDSFNGIDSDLFTPHFRLRGNPTLHSSPRPQPSKDVFKIYLDYFSQNVNDISNRLMASLQTSRSVLLWLISSSPEVPDEQILENISSLSEENIKENETIRNAIKMAFELSRNNRTFTGLYMFAADEDVFSISYYIFNLFEVAKEIRNLLIKLLFLKKFRTKRRKFYFHTFSILKERGRDHDELHVLSTPFASHDIPDSGNSVEELVARGEEHNWEDNSKNTESLSFSGKVRKRLPRFRSRLWKVSHWLIQSKDVKYGLKMAAGISLLSIVAFQKSTAHDYGEWNGQWALISTLFVLEVTVSATLRVGFFRALGTLSGAVYAYVAWEISRGWSYVIASLTFLVSWLSCYIMFRTSYAGVATVFNITFPPILYGAYLGNKSSSFHLAVFRFLDVIVGIGMAIVVNIVVFPYLARRVLTKEIGKACQLNLQLYNTMSEYMLSSTHHASTSLCDDMENQIVFHLLKAGDLLLLTNMEFRLKGPFPGKLFQQLIDKLGIMTGRLVILNKVRARFGPYLYQEVVENVIRYRKSLIASISLTLYILSHSIMVKSPVPYFLPSSRNAHWNLRQAIMKDIQIKTGFSSDNPDDTYVSDESSPTALSAALWLHGNEGVLYYYAECQVIEEIVNDLEDLLMLVKRINGEEKKPKLWNEKL
ncbi:malate transmembrane transporter [Schizosaccharomyces osmophilus]|uniref:Malate transmembrane transporter n=1 Tax=Schizosaccharomyces osmophilus TaxID=2545709 RepID=A0AAE9WD29_9SCHI|nr:malate transmembrane transporter [Schizosaccharomyces osmophilus]WBW74197.1 malate transmembrane transporter [Schizosaccharomyces osmophilus]